MTHENFLGCLRLPDPCHLNQETPTQLTPATRGGMILHTNLVRVQAAVCPVFALVTQRRNIWTLLECRGVQGLRHPKGGIFLVQ